MTLFAAGHETTALALAHAFYFLDGHPAVERRAAAEVRRVLGDRTPAADDTESLPRLQQVLNETLRLLPPAWITAREALEPVDLGALCIPAGTQVLMSQWVVHRDPRWYPDPEAFVPERWDSPQSIHRFAFLPFGGGPRVCIGSHFATTQAILLLALVLWRFRIEVLPDQRLELRPSLSLGPRGPGLWARLAAPEA